MRVILIWRDTRSAGFTEVSGPGIILTLDDKTDLKLAITRFDCARHGSEARARLLLGADAAAFSINGIICQCIGSKCIGLTIAAINKG